MAFNDYTTTFRRLRCLDGLHSEILYFSLVLNYEKLNFSVWGINRAITQAGDELLFWHKLTSSIH